MQSCVFGRWRQSSDLISVDALSSRHDGPIDHTCLTSTRMDKLVVESKRRPLDLPTPNGQSAGNRRLQFALSCTLKTVPESAGPPAMVVPYKLPSLVCNKAPLGRIPSLGLVPKEYNSVSVPPGVIL
jgi:hypothetical protein